MSKSLSNIQTVFKILRIFCKVVFILCIVGAVGCALGIVCVSFIPLLPNEITELIADEAQMSIGAMMIACFAGLCVCASEAVLFRFGEIYFKNELEAGTPFTLEGSREIFRLGVLSIAVSVGVSLFLGIVIAIWEAVSKGTLSFDISTSFSLGRGLVLMFASLIFKHGAEISQGDTDKENG